MATKMSNEEEILELYKLRWQPKRAMSALNN
jgi:hypothetical protein